MNVFNTFTRRCLWENKTRTIVTIVGIILSMSLFTAVLEGAYSGTSFLVRCATETFGDWHGLDFGLSKEEINDRHNDNRIEWTNEMNLLGWGEIGSLNEYKPYILVSSLDEDMKNHLPIKIIQGRFAKDSSEIVICEHMKNNGGVELKVGDNFTVDLGQRVNRGNDVLLPDIKLCLDNESISSPKSYTFTVVGLCERLPNSIEDYSCPGYMAFTTGFDNCDSFISFIKVKDSKDVYDLIYNNERVDSTNGTLLAYSGITKYRGVNTLIIRFGTILCIMVMVGSVSLIYNSFSISVSERIKMFGILKSIGATKRQINYSVFYEALILSAIGIPLGLIFGLLGIGITLWCLKDSFAGIIDSGIYTEMRLELNPYIIALAVLICLLTTFLSALIPAIKASKLSAIESIRLTDSIKILPNDLKIPAVVEKRFGFEGLMAAKNFKRNKRKYRTVVISLGISIILFVSAISFCDELKRNLIVLTGEGNAESISFEQIGIKPDEVVSLYKMLSEVNGVKEVVYYHESGELFQVKTKYYSERLLSILDEIGLKEAITATEFAEEYLEMIFIDEESYNKYCKAEGLDPKDYNNKENPKAILYNDGMNYYESIDSENLWYEGAYYSDNLIGNSIECSIYNTIEGMVLINSFDDTFVYCKEEDFESMCLDNYDLSDLDSIKNDGYYLEYKTRDEAIKTIEMTIGALTYNPIFPCAYNNLCIIYPITLKHEVLGEYYDYFGDYIDFAMKANNPRKTFVKVKETILNAGYDTSHLINNSSSFSSKRMLSNVVTVFSFGFITIMSLICIANVFNIISTNILLRRREFAMLKSVGLSSVGFKKMMYYECAIFGIRSILWATPVSFVVSFVIFLVSNVTIRTIFIVPFKGWCIMIVFVFVIVFSTMIYSTSKIKKNNLIDELKNENI